MLGPSKKTRENLLQRVIKSMFHATITALFGVIVCAAASANTIADTAICNAAARDPATKALLDPPPMSIDGSAPHIYKSVGGLDLRLHVFDSDRASAPASRRAKRPAILFFFGGAWEYGTVKELIEPAKHFSKRGAVSVLVDYRVFCRNGSSIADEISDAKSAVRYIRKHAIELGIDPDRIVVSGASAGGHLALSTATLDGFDSAVEDRTVSSKPNFLALMYPCSDATTDEEKKYGGDAIGSHGREVSPLYHLKKNLPPMLIIQGTDDIVYEENKQLCAESKALGNACELVIYQGASHGFFGPEVDQGKWYRQALMKMDAGLTQAGYLKRTSR